MYRINLYPEHATKRRAATQRMILTAALAGLLGVEALLAGALVVSAVLLSERTRSMEASIRELRIRVAAEVPPGAEVGTALELLQLRAARTLWAPKLVALSDCIDRSLILDEVRARVPSRGRAARLELGGVIHGGGSRVDQVSRFVGALRDEPRVAGEFPQINLETIEEDDRFLVTCSPAGGGD